MSQTEQQSGKISDVELRSSMMALKAIAYKLLLKKHDPYEFIKYEWPDLVITDKEELKEFREHCKRKDWLDLRLDDFQVDMIKAAFDKRHTQIFVSGGTKLGKGFCVGGIIVNAHYTLHKESKTILIGPDVEHVKKNLYGETLTWRRRMTSFKDGSERVECLTEKMSDPGSEDHFVVILNPQKGEGLSGNHSKQPLFVCDEASGAADTRYTDMLSQCPSGLLICIGNPRQPSGFFYRAFKRFETGCKTVKSEAGPRRLISIGLVDCINVRANRVNGFVSPPTTGMTVDGVEIPEGEIIPEELRHKTRLLIPGQGCKFAVATIMKSAPADEVEWRVFGRFPKEARAYTLFQESWWDKSIEIHERIKESLRYEALGLDVAASEHGDYCALAWGETRGCKEIDLIQNPNTSMLKGEIYHLASQKGLDLRGGYIPIGIDTGNMGGPLADMMELDGCFIIRIGGQAGPDNREIYANKRAETYGELAGAMNPQTTHKEIWAIPDDDMLHEELMALERIFLPDGKRYKLNSKARLSPEQKARNQNNVDSIQEKIGRSPDRADALGYLYQAVKQLPDYFDTVAEQFDPSRYVRDFKDIGGGEYLVTLWDGELKKMDKTAFHEKFGMDPKVLQL